MCVVIRGSGFLVPEPGLPASMPGRLFSSTRNRGLHYTRGLRQDPAHARIAARIVLPNSRRSI
jgi:hypothetical protein